uniref:Uncharacterized protein n=1 Tax=Arundo donax TaxID=35708 RepID=A0A0A8YDS1_ARUDO
MPYPTKTSFAAKDKRNKPNLTGHDKLSALL